MALKFSMLLEAIDRVTGPSRRIQNSMRNIGRNAREMAQNLGRAGREAGQVNRLDVLSRKLAGGFAAAGNAARRYAGKMGIGSWGDAAELAGVGVGSLAKKLGGLALSAAKWAGAAAVGAGGFALFDLFGTASKFEQFEISLRTIIGSAEGARQAMSWVQDFAQKTPYELEQVMAAFVSLKSFGIDPVGGALEAMGDAAAGMNTSLDDAVQAVADGMNGQMERLLAFGVKGSSAGDKIRLTYVKAGKEVTVQAKKGIEAQNAIVGIMRERFGGLMRAQSSTFQGIINNLKDKWSGFLLLIARAGIFDKVKGKLEEWLAKLDQMAKDGRLQAWAEAISAKLEKAFDYAVQFIEGPGWGPAIDRMKQLATAAGLVADAIIKISEYGRKLGWLADFAGGVPTITSRLYNEASERGMLPSLSPARSSPLTPGSGPTRTGQGPMQVGGKIALEVFTQAGTAVRLKEMNSTNAKVPLLFKTGKSMGGPA